MAKRIDYLRLSITDRCNLNCIYCTPLEKKDFLAHDDVLRYEEMAETVRLFAKCGIKRVRLTGGEPLIKKGITDLIKMIKKIDGIEDIAMTTNGVYLKQTARDLKSAGLNRVNISMDTLNRDNFKRITGHDCFPAVWEGIKEALRINLNPVKINVIPMRGINDGEILDFAALTVKHPLTVRFIEFFHTNNRTLKLSNRILKNSNIKETIINHFGGITPAPKSEIAGKGPARYYKLKNAKGTIGFISNSSNSFCGTCNRIRINCAGKISPCLFSGYLYDIKVLLRNKTSENEIIDYINKILKAKSKYTKHLITERKIEMSSVGG